MNKILLVYWPENGNVEAIALKLKNKFPTELIKKPISEINQEDLKLFDNWIIGGSTVGSHIWEDANDSNKWLGFFRMLDGIDMSAKTVAFYGLGDQVLYPDHFVNGLGIFQEEFGKRDARIVGQWPVTGYDHTDSEGMDGDMFFGLALDEDHQEELTDDRIDKWLKIIEKEFK